MSSEKKDTLSPRESPPGDQKDDEDSEAGSNTDSEDESESTSTSSSADSDDDSRLPEKEAHLSSSSLVLSASPSPAPVIKRRETFYNSSKYEATPVSSSAFFHVTLLRTERVKTGNSLPFTAYKLRVSTTDSTKWILFRRYSEFRALMNHLKKIYGKDVVPHKFPPKKILGNMNPQLIDKRHMALQTWLNKVLNSEKLGRCPEVVRFLEESKQNEGLVEIEYEESLVKLDLEKIGYLFKLHKNQWKTGWFIMRHGILYKYRTHLDRNPYGKYLWEDIDVQPVDLDLHKTAKIVKVDAEKAAKQKHYCFRVTTPKGKQFIFSAQTPEERSDWITALLGSCGKKTPTNSDGSNQKVLAIPLEKVQHVNEFGVPVIVSCLLTYLRATALDDNTLFTKPPEQILIDQIEEGELDFELINDANAVAGIVLLFLRELPTPVLTFELHDCFVGVVEVQNQDTQLKILKALIEALPLLHRNLLFTLLSYLGGSYKNGGEERLDQLSNIFSVLLLRHNTNSQDKESADVMAHFEKKEKKKDAKQVSASHQQLAVGTGIAHIIDLKYEKIAATKITRLLILHAEQLIGPMIEYHPEVLPPDAVPAKEEEEEEEEEERRGEEAVIDSEEGTERENPSQVDRETAKDSDAKRLPEEVVGHAHNDNRRKTFIEIEKERVRTMKQSKDKLRREFKLLEKQEKERVKREEKERQKQQKQQHKAEKKIDANPLPDKKQRDSGMLSDSDEEGDDSDEHSDSVDGEEERLTKEQLKKAKEEQQRLKREKAKEEQDRLREEKEMARINKEQAREREKALKEDRERLIRAEKERQRVEKERQKQKEKLEREHRERMLVKEKSAQKKQTDQEETISKKSKVAVTTTQPDQRESKSSRSSKRPASSDPTVVLKSKHHKDPESKSPHKKPVVSADKKSPKHHSKEDKKAADPKKDHAKKTKKIRKRASGSKEQQEQTEVAIKSNTVLSIATEVRVPAPSDSDLLQSSSDSDSSSSSSSSSSQSESEEPEARSSASHSEGSSESEQEHQDKREEGEQQHEEEHRKTEASEGISDSDSDSESDLSERSKLSRMVSQLDSGSEAYNLAPSGRTATVESSSEKEAKPEVSKGSDQEPVAVIALDTTTPIADDSKDDVETEPTTRQRAPTVFDAVPTVAPLLSEGSRSTGGDVRRRRPTRDHKQLLATMVVDRVEQTPESKPKPLTPQQVMMMEMSRVLKMKKGGN